MTPTTERARTKHEELTRRLRELAATLEPGDRFPSQSELMREYPVSDRTVLRSLDELSRAGSIVRRRGSGTYVSDRTRHVKETTPPAASDAIAALSLTCTPSRFYQHCLDVLSVLAEQAGWPLVAQHARDEHRYEDVLPLEALRPRGFLALHYNLYAIAHRLQERGHRTVIVGSPPVGVTPEVPCVMGDHEEGGYLAARHLLDLGHRRIAFARFNFSPGLMRTTRWKGHLRAQEQAAREDLGAEWTLIEPDRLRAWRSAPALAADYFRRPCAPTAVLAWNDSEADTLLRIFHVAGLRVPEDLSLVGYDALPDGDHFVPALTTVDQHVTRQLRYALDLLSRPTAPPATQSVVVVPSLVRRASCGPPCR